MKKLFVVVTITFFLVFLSVVFALQFEAQVRIDKGWNLIYGFANPSQLSGRLEESSIKAIYAFQPTTQEYIRMYPNREDSKITMDDDELLDTSFWVYSSEETGDIFNNVMNAVEYELYNDLVPINEHKLYRGWNFLGVTPNFIGNSLNDLKGDCEYLKAHYWNSEKQGWEPTELDLVIENTEYEPNLVNNLMMTGIVIKIARDCQMGHLGGSITPPPIPG